MAALPLLNGLRVPVFCAPMFLVSDPDLVVAACTAGVVGTFNHLNARTAGDFERWMDEITARLDEARRADPGRTVAPFAVNVAVRRAPREERYDHDMEVIREYEVPLVISMNGSPRRIAETVHGYGGVLIHDVPSVELARKAVDAGADGLIALCGERAGTPARPAPSLWCRRSAGSSTDPWRWRRRQRWPGHQGRAVPGGRLRVYGDPLHRHPGVRCADGVQGATRVTGHRGRRRHRRDHRSAGQLPSRLDRGRGP